tara:strand:+ start:180 stop:305 length:126 start_codon:yes stop_codon:yes gene_type:complete
MTAIKVLTAVSLAMAGMFIVGMGNNFGFAFMIPMTVMRFTL